MRPFWIEAQDVLLLVCHELSFFFFPHSYTHRRKPRKKVELLHSLSEHRRLQCSYKKMIHKLNLSPDNNTKGVEFTHYRYSWYLSSRDFENYFHCFGILSMIFKLKLW